MNRILILTLAAALALPAATFAAKADKPAKGEGKGVRPGKVLKGLDTNSNHLIDGDEIDALRKAFAADAKGPLAKIDRNADGKLDDDEIQALNARMEKHAERKGAKKKK